MRARTQRRQPFPFRLAVIAAASLLAIGCTNDPSLTTFRDTFATGLSDGLKAIFAAFVDASVASVTQSSSASTNAAQTTP
ncbi:MAG: hypothetical protein U1D55_17540 [Phycisphaerae bacterium]